MGSTVIILRTKGNKPHGRSFQNKQKRIYDHLQSSRHHPQTSFTNDKSLSKGALAGVLSYTRHQCLCHPRRALETREILDSQCVTKALGT